MAVTVSVRIPRALDDLVRTDLLRPHPFAGERIGFLSGSIGTAEDERLLILLTDYHPIPDEQYVRDPMSGARIGSEAIRSAMQRVLDTGRSLFHVHLHLGSGRPELSKLDRREIPRLVASLDAVRRDRPHGLVLLSDDNWRVWVRRAGSDGLLEADRLAVVGYPMSVTTTQHDEEPASDRYARQSFLGQRSQTAFERTIVGIVGHGGGGSHIGQQLAHIGFKRYRVFDGDHVEETNLNRLIGGCSADVAAKTAKCTVAERTIRSLVENPEIICHPGRWQERPELLRGCDIVFGGVDTFAERRELEAACRRYLIPYIDIGMDVHQIAGEPPRMAGQVILSMPGGPCMFCLGFLNEERLALEAARYGDVGGRPQVVWPNAILASTAVGIGVDLVSGWTRERGRTVYLSYDGNLGAITAHPRLRFISPFRCPHHPLSHVGPPVFGTLKAH